MQQVDLLSAVQPDSGWFAIVGIKGGDDRRQRLVATREEADDLVQKYMERGYNVFFGVAKFREFKREGGRKKDNVLALRSFWVDIDCGPTKAAPDEKTGRPDGYIDQAAGLTALKQFCTTVGLPRPLLVNSGRGIHAYWPLDRDVTREEWEPVAARLSELCVTHNFYVDPSVFEVARILRVPGTLNFKDNPPKPVTLISGAKPTSFEEFRNALGVRELQPLVVPEERSSNLRDKLKENTTFRFSKIMRRSAKGDGCQQLLNAYKQRESLSEVRWFDALSIAKFCVDRDTAIQKMSEGHPDYDPYKALAKTKHISGPHNCATFDRNNPGGCYGCAYIGRIKNPIVLGKEVDESEAQDGVYTVTEEDAPEELKIPAFPRPYVRGKKGGIYLLPDKEEAEPLLVYEHDLYVVKMMTDPKEGDVVLMRLHLPKEGIREFVLTLAVACGDSAELRKAVARKGVAATAKQFPLVAHFITMSVKEIQHLKRNEQMRLQFGWADNDSKFIIGDREISIDGVYHSPPSTITEGLAQYLTPAGSFDKWKEVFNLYGREGLELHAFAALTAFGAPLFKFTGQSGAIINVIHPRSGTGKTTILHMCNSVWGHPKDLCAIKEDTANAKTMHLGIMNNLPFTVDEITNMVPGQFSEMTYNMSQGRGKNRMKSSGNELRLNSTTWQTISLCSSNASFYEKLQGQGGKRSPDGEMMRLLEYKIGYSDAIPTDIAKEMFDHQLMANYGHAGSIYAQWIVSNLEEAKKTIKVVQAKIDRELRLTQRERFWSAQVASIIAGGLIAKRLGLIDWDMRRIYKAATDLINEVRKDVAPPPETTSSILGEYLNRHIHNILVVNGNVDRRSNLEAPPVDLPKGELLIRYEPDTKRLYVNSKHFKDDCTRVQINHKEFVQDMEKRGVMLKPENKRLTKGTAVSTLPVYCMVFDTSVGDFLDLTELTGEKECAGGEECNTPQGEAESDD